MDEKIKLLKNLDKLIKLAHGRKTTQGLTVYEGAISKIANVYTRADLNILLEKLNHALSGIEAHGHFTSDEYQIVQEIRRMKD